MIKANELRIGNIINYQGVKKIVNSLSSESIDVCYLANYGEFKYPNTPIEHIKPIPLTEELLLKCGFISRSFKMSDISIKKDTNLYTLVYDLIKSECYLDLDFTFMTLDNEIKYLHQLQNLYFALTGEELEIKL